MNLLDPIEKIMTRNPITVSSNDPLTVVKEIFQENKIHHIPVVNKGQLVGMVSKSDYLFFQRGYDNNPESEQVDRLGETNVMDIMTKNIAVMEPSDRVNVALEVFKENLFHAIPIANEGKLLGIVTTFDIINHLATDQMAVNQYTT